MGPKSIPFGFGPQHTEQVTQLTKCLASRLLHRFHRPRGTLRIVGNNGLGGTGLHRHQADLMGDNVVQLAGDTSAFLGYRATGFGGLFSFELRSALLEETQVFPTNPDTPAEVPHEEHNEKSEPDVRDRLPIAKVVDRNHSAIVPPTPM